MLEYREKHKEKEIMSLRNSINFSIYCIYAFYMHSYILCIINIYTEKHRTTYFAHHKIGIILFI